MAKDFQTVTAGKGRPAGAKAETPVPDDPNLALVEAYPGAALVVDDGGSVIAANSNGTGIEALLTHAAVPAIVALR